MYWPAANAVMYSVVQPRFFSLYADVCALIFASIMSYITYNDCQLDPSAKIATLCNSQSDWLAKGTAGLSDVISTLKQTN